MHQPYYKKAGEKDYFLPWVRLHAVKDYYPFAYIVSEFNSLKANFNFSGILVKQLADYAFNNATDYFLELSKKDPRYLSPKEKRFIIDRFFSVNLQTMIYPYPRYNELYVKYLAKNYKLFTDKDIFDLQVYFNLVWFHSISFTRDKNLFQILKKGRDFSEDDKKYIFIKQYEIIQGIFPLYQQLIAEKKIELSVTPFYHPILPLLCDTDIVKNFSYLKTPVARFSYPQDAFWHIEKAKQEAEDKFNCPIFGSWPSEGSVSETIVDLYKENNFNWIMTDEDILFKSLQNSKVSIEALKKQRHIVYQAYNYEGLNIMFRDKNLSDAIGFNYHHWPNLKMAAVDLINHFRNINNFVSKIYKEHAVVIAMDGENAWEYYPDNGRLFIDTLYKEIENAKFIKSSTVSSFIENSTVKRIPRISPGSWINGDFGVWVGSDKNNHNWQLLWRIRKELNRKDLSPNKYQKALEYLRVIEGSDWNWWNTFEDIQGDFSKIFLSYVKQIYKILGIKYNFK